MLAVVAPARDGVVRAVVHATIVPARQPQILQRFLPHQTKFFLNQLCANLHRVDSLELIERAGAPAVEARDGDAAVGGTHVSRRLTRAQPIAHHREKSLRRGRRGWIPDDAAAFRVDEFVPPSHLLDPRVVTIVGTLGTLGTLGTVVRVPVLLEPVL